MPDCSSTAYTVVSLPALAGQQHGRMGRPHGRMSCASVAHASRPVACEPARRGAVSSTVTGTVPKSGGGLASQPQGADSRSATAQAACEGVLRLYMRGCADSSVSNASLHKLAQYLPPSVFQLLEVLGSAWRLQKLLKAYGGASIRVPTVWAAADNPLRAVLGKRGLKKFMDMYGGTDLYIPRCANFVRRLRDEAILRDYALLAKKGSSLRQAVGLLSARYDLSDRHVRTILNTIS